MDGNSVLGMDQQGHKPSITVGGNELGPKRIILIGASMTRDFTTCHHLQTTPDNELTGSERRRARELVKNTLVDVFRKSKPQYQNPTPVEDVESQHPDNLAYGIDIRSFKGTQHDGKVPDGCYKPSLGHDIRIEVKGRSFHIHDIDGNKSERKEWATYFQAADSFMFVVSLISYSTPSWRDPSAVNIDRACFNDIERLIISPKTQMQEYLTLFESVTTSSHLRYVPIVLLFTNYDLLRQRMKDYPVVDYYPDYSGSSNPSITCRYFAEKFANMLRAQSLEIYVTNKVEQDDEDLQSAVDRLCPNLFPRGLTAVPELPE